MSQLIIDNAAAISFDRDVTVAQTISASRNLKWFRKGPIQNILEVQINVIRRNTYQSILADLSNNLVGSYTLTLPSEVVGTNPFRSTARVMGANQSASTLVVDGLMPNDVIAAGTHVGVVGVNGTYITTESETANASGIVTLNLDQPIINIPSDNAQVAAGNSIGIPYYLVQRPRASFGPTGLVNHDGPFIFAQVL